MSRWERGKERDTRRVYESDAKVVCRRAGGGKESLGREGLAGARAATAGSLRSLQDRPNLVLTCWRCKDAQSPGDWRKWKSAVGDSATAGKEATLGIQRVAPSGSALTPLRRPSGTALKRANRSAAALPLGLTVLGLQDLHWRAASVVGLEDAH